MSLTKSESAGGFLGLNAWIALSIFPLAAVSLAIAAYRSQPGDSPRLNPIPTVVADAYGPATPDEEETFEEASTPADSSHGATHPTAAATQPLSLAPQ
jgi:hypothetical protein